MERRYHSIPAEDLAAAKESSYANRLGFGDIRGVLKMAGRDY